MAGSDIDKAQVSDRYCSEFCSSQIAEVLRTLREEPAVDLIVSRGGALVVEMVCGANDGNWSAASRKRW